jgi:dolichol-phosphate mannosyltransferase
VNPSPHADKISFVIPVYQEDQSLELLEGEIRAVMANVGGAYEIIFVDDGSKDQSWNVIQSLATSQPTVRGIRFRRNFGKAAALQAGFRHATGNIVFTLDADLQDDPKEIPRFLEQLQAGYQLVSGYKKVRHDPWHKVFPSRVFNGMISLLTGVKLHDHNCGFKAYRAEVVREISLYGELHRFVPVLAASQGFRVSEITVDHRPRKYGSSKFGTRRFLKGFLDLVQTHFLTTFGWRPMHFFGTCATGLALAAFGLAGLFVLNLLLRWLIEPTWGAGPLTQTFSVAALMMCLLLSGQCLLTGYIAEMMAL